MRSPRWSTPGGGSGPGRSETLLMGAGARALLSHGRAARSGTRGDGGGPPAGGGRWLRRGDRRDAGEQDVGSGALGRVVEGESSPVAISSSPSGAIISTPGFGLPRTSRATCSMSTRSSRLPSPARAWSRRAGSDITSGRSRSQATRPSSAFNVGDWASVLALSSDFDPEPIRSTSLGLDSGGSQPGWRHIAVSGAMPIVSRTRWSRSSPRSRIHSPGISSDYGRLHLAYASGDGAGVDLVLERLGAMSPSASSPVMSTCRSSSRRGSLRRPGQMVPGRSSPRPGADRRARGGSLR